MVDTAAAATSRLIASDEQIVPRLNDLLAGVIWVLASCRPCWLVPFENNKINSVFVIKRIERIFPLSFTNQYNQCGYFNFPRIDYSSGICILHHVLDLSLCHPACQCSPSFLPCRPPCHTVVDSGARCVGVTRWGLSEGGLRNSLPPSLLPSILTFPVCKIPPNQADPALGVNDRP